MVGAAVYSQAPPTAVLRTPLPISGFTRVPLPLAPALVVSTAIYDELLLYLTDARRFIVFLEWLDSREPHLAAALLSRQRQMNSGGDIVAAAVSFLENFATPYARVMGAAAPTGVPPRPMDVGNSPGGLWPQVLFTRARLGAWPRRFTRSLLGLKQPLYARYIGPFGSGPVTVPPGAEPVAYFDWDGEMPYTLGTQGRLNKSAELWLRTRATAFHELDASARDASASADFLATMDSYMFARLLACHWPTYRNNVVMVRGYCAPKPAVVEEDEARLTGGGDSTV